MHCLCDVTGSVVGDQLGCHRRSRQPARPVLQKYTALQSAGWQRQLFQARLYSAFERAYGACLSGINVIAVIDGLSTC